MVIKLGKDLKVGNGIKVWLNGDKGMLVTKILDYNGPYSFVCGIAVLKGERRESNDVFTSEMTLETDAAYEIVEPCDILGLLIV